MAIIDSCPEFTVSVIVDGQPAEEYPPPDDTSVKTFKTPRHDCYIESKSGQLFFFKVTVAPGREISQEKALGLQVFVDGKFSAGRACHTRPCLETPRDIVIRGPLEESTDSGTAVEWSLAFSPISAIEDATNEKIQRDTKISEHLGSILVVVSDCKFIGLRTETWPPTSDWKKDLVLAEKAMKGRELSHGSVLSHGQPTKNHDIAMTREHVPIAMYRFQYRSRAALQKEYVLPHTPPLEGFPTEGQIGPLTAEEIRTITEKRLRDKGEPVIKEEGQSPGIKRVFNTEDDDDVIEVGSRPRFKIVKLKNGDDVLDLTEDAS